MDSLSINMLDMLVVAVLLLSAALAFFRGFVHEVLSITAWVGAAFITLRGLPLARPFAHNAIAVSWAADAVAAGGLFLGSLLILSLLTRMVAQRVQNSGLGSLDRSLGFVFGLVRGGLILSLAFVVVRLLMPTADTRPDWINNARTTPMMERGADILLSLAPQQLLSDQEKARAAAQEAQEKARQAIEMKETYDKLIQPRPGLAEQQQQQELATQHPATGPATGGISLSTPPANASAVATPATRASSGASGGASGASSASMPAATTVTAPVVRAVPSPATTASAPAQATTARTAPAQTTPAQTTPAQTAPAQQARPVAPATQAKTAPATAPSPAPAAASSTVAHTSEKPAAKAAKATAETHETAAHPAKPAARAQYDDESQKMLNQLFQQQQ